MPVTSDEAIAHVADLFRLMGDPSRLRIIVACLGQPISVGDLARRLDLSPSLVSHHLRLLRAARVLKGVRKGKRMFYSACDGHIECIIEDMLTHIGEPDESA